MQCVRRSITGASGNVSREVVKQALAVGLQVRATFQSPAVAAKAPVGLEGVIMDYAKPETIRPALHGVEKILLVGPLVQNLPALEANFVKEVRRAGPKHIVKISALGGRESMFSIGHRDSEENIEASGLAYTFLRPNGFMQNLVNYNAGTIRSHKASGRREQINWGGGIAWPPSDSRLTNVGPLTPRAAHDFVLR